MNSAVQHWSTLTDRHLYVGNSAEILRLSYVWTDCCSTTNLPCPGEGGGRRGKGVKGETLCWIGQHNGWRIHFAIPLNISQYQSISQMQIFAMLWKYPWLELTFSTVMFICWSCQESLCFAPFQLVFFCDSVKGPLVMLKYKITKKNT